MQKDKLRQLIADGKTQQAFEELLKPELSSDKQWLPDLTTLSGKYSRLEREKRLGTISNEEYLRENAKIDSALSEMIEAYETPAAKGTEALPATVAKADKQPCQLPATLKAYDLQPCTDPDPAHWVLHRNRGTYVMDEQCRLLGLNLSGLEVKDASFFQTPDFQYLKALSLSEASLTTLRLPAQLTALQHLNVGDCANLKTLVFDGPLPALLTIVADECALTALELPAGMTALRSLNLRKNQLTRLHFAGPSPSLSFLDASQNKLKELRFPGGFGALQYVYLNDNPGLHTLTFDAVAEVLEVLHLRGCALRELPNGLVYFSNLNTLYLYGNPLPKVPKGASGVPEGERDNAAPSLRNYLRSITEDKAIPNDEVKLVLIGNSTAGKSSLLRYLRNGSYDGRSVSTHGISNELWPDSGLGFKVNIWDFGGQEFYHATHRLFLTDNAVTLVAFEAATNCQKEIELHLRLYEDGEAVERTLPIEVFPYIYWLESLRYFCRGGQKALLVQTKIDEEARERVPIELRHLMDEEGHIKVTDADRSKYHLPAETPRISVQNAHAGDEDARANFTLFKKKLFDALRGAIGKYPFSEKWLLIKNELRARPASQKWMRYEEYVRFCEQLRPNISQKGEGQSISMLDTLTDYLHETGVILWYRHHDTLKKTVFIKPKWVVDTIYKVLDYKVMDSDGGKFDRAHAARVAPDIDTDDLIKLMIEFELIFPVDNEAERYIAPQYLPNRDPKTPGSLFADLAEDCGQLLFVLRFPDYQPRSVITRFMCKYGPLAEGKYWKNGILFKKYGTWVWANRSDNKDIILRSSKAEYALGHELFATLRDITDHNPELLISPNGEDFVRMGDLFDLPPKDPNPSVKATNGKWLNISDFHHFFPHAIETAEFAVKTGQVNITPLKKEQPVTETPHTAPATAPPKPKVFISYAHKDEQFKDEIIVHLASLKNQGLIEHWNDRQIESGFWNPQIEKAMQEADIFLLLVSPNFLNSGYINEKEIAKAYEKFKAGEAKIFPIICDACSWDLQPVSEEMEMHPVHKRLMKIWMGKFQPFPKDGKPIRKWRNKNEAYTSVIKSLTDEILKIP